VCDPDCAEKGQSAEANRALKRRLVAEGIAHAALVHDGDRAVAWAEYGSPEELPNIQGNCVMVRDVAPQAPS
jgi:hypothetical protein